MSSSSDDDHANIDSLSENNRDQEISPEGSHHGQVVEEQSGETSSTMAGILGNIGPFDDTVEQWSAYTERFEFFVLANGVSADKKVATFLTVMGAKTFNLFRALAQPKKPGEFSYDQIVKILSEHFSPKPLMIAERFRFYKRNQEEGETVTMFVAALRKLAEHCEFKDETLNDAIRDRLVCGLRNEAMQRKLLTEDKLTLTKAIEISVSMEMAAKDAQQLSAATAKVLKIASAEDSSLTKPCYRCAQQGHLAAECWCKELECHACGKKGHIEKACRSKKKGTRGIQKNTHKQKKASHNKTVHVMEKETSDSESTDEELPVHILSVDGGTDRYCTTPLLEGKPVRMEIDTGAAVSLVSEAVYRKHLKHLSIQPARVVLKTYTGEVVAVKGLVKVKVELNGQCVKLPLYVVQGNYPSLLGRSWMNKVRIDWAAVRMLSQGESALEAVLKKNSELFSEELGQMKDITAKLILKPGSNPRFLKARPVPYALRQKVEKELHKLVTSGVLEPVSVSDWATPIVPVLKKSGSLRICGDFKVTVNPVLQNEHYPMPLIDDLYAGLANGKQFSKLDLNQAYLQMPVDPESKELLTVNTHKGLFRYRRLAFGIKTAPALFQKAMDQILAGLPGVQCYLDDILVTGKDDADHLHNLDMTLQRLREYGLKVRKEKCAFFQASLEYLGHVIDEAGLHKNPSKTKAIVEAPAPQNVNQLRSYLGLLNYYGRFIPNLSTLLKPLHGLLVQGRKWEWSEACQRAFASSKKALLNSEVLTHFDPALPLQLACDASPYGVGAVVSHIMPDGTDKPIAFASKTLNKAECNYAQIEREALSIVFGIRKFHQYLFGRKFTLLTDHKPLTALLGPHTGIPPLAASRMQRWALLLSGHDYDIKYRRSALHGNADGLSRLPLPAARPVTQQTDIFYFQQVDDTPVTAKQVRQATRNNPVLSAVMEAVIKGRRISDAPDSRPYLARQQELSVQSGCLLWGRRVIIPPSLRCPMLKQLHVGHSGTVRMKELARSYFWWPGLDKHIEENAAQCTTCQTVRNTPPPAAVHPWEWPAEPWQRVHIDFAGPFEGRMLLVVVDAHSKWPDVAIMKSTTTGKTIERLEEMFSRYGLPEQLVSDNGPQFVAEEMEAFLKKNGIQHIKSAPYHPSTNGLAERFVQTLKHSLKASTSQGSLHHRLHSFLLTYRNTPHSTTKAAPAELLLKRGLRTKLDCVRPPARSDIVRSSQQEQSRRRSATPRSFRIGDSVLARNYLRGPKWVPAVIVATTGPLSYHVRTGNDAVWRRHTDQLLASRGPSAEPVGSPALDNPVPVDTEGGRPVPDTQPTMLPEDDATDQTPQAPVTVEPMPPSSPVMEHPRRYPTRERRPPERLDM